MLSIKENKKPQLKVCEMICDKGLHPKLNKYDLTSFLNKHSTTLLVGRSGSGKTSLLYSFFKSREIFKNTFDKIFLFQPEQSRASMKDKLFDKIPDDQKYNELNLENLMEVEDNLSEYNNVILMDDMGAYLKDNEIKKKLKELVFNRRHKHLTIIFLVQTYLSIEKDIRKLFSNIFIFKCSKKEMETIFDEIVELPKDYILPIMKVVYDKPHNYLFINTDEQRLFKNFDEILIE
jgi:ABC-type phosphate transport system ATPase subunit